MTEERGMDAEALIKDILTRESAKMDTSALFSFKGHPAVHVATNGDDLHKMKAWVDSLSTKELLRALDFTFCRDDSDAAAENGVVSSHEYELLKQMLAMQSSPPTPIHPRALLYKPATIRGATDGRDEEDRVLKNRLHAPRFFQFLEKKDLGGGSLFEADMSQSQSNWKKSRITNRGQNRRSQQRPRRASKFDVLARKFVTSSGETLTVGTTEDQRIADEMILLRSKMKYEKLGSVPSRCLLCLPQWMGKADILNLLRIASRGNFMSASPSFGKGRNNEQIQRALQSTFFAPWLDPTVRWFSLSMYLASRFEVSLWDTFYQNKMGSSLSICSDSSSIEQTIQNISHRKAPQLFQKAVCKAVMTSFLLEDISSGRLMDCSLWKVLSKSEYATVSTPQTETDFLSICMIPLVELGTVSEAFRLETIRCLMEDIAQQAQLKLLQDNDGGKLSPGTPTRGAKKIRKKNKKKKQRKKSVGARQAENTPGCSIQFEPGTLEDIKAQSSLLESNIIEFSSCAIIQNSTRPSRESNKKYIFVLLIIEDIIGSVFKKVGLGKSDATVVNMQEVTKRRGAQHRPDYNSLPLKISSRKNLSSCHRKPNQARHKHNSERKVIPQVPTRKHGGSQWKLNQTKDKLTNDASKSLSQLTSFYVPIETKNIKSGDPDATTDEPSLSAISLNSFQQQNQGDQQQMLSAEQPNSQHDWNNTSASPLFDVIGMSLNLGGTYHEWGGMKKYQSREKSLFAEFFNNVSSTQKNIDELLMAASTAASIASSSGDEVQYDMQQVDEDVENEATASAEIGDDSKSILSDDDKYYVMTNVSEPKSPVSSSVSKQRDEDIHSCKEKKDRAPILPLSQSPTIIEKGGNNTSQLENEAAQSPPPSEPPTPPPQLSPIQVSLADIKKLRKQNTEEIRKEFEKAMSLACSSPVQVAGSLRSLPSSPKTGPKRTWSRDDLRLQSFNGDELLRRRPRGLSRHADVTALSYRNAVLSIAKSERKASSACSHDGLAKCTHDGNSGDSVASTLTGKHRPLVDGTKTGIAAQPRKLSPKGCLAEGGLHMNCAQSETALEGHDDSIPWSVTPKAAHHEEMDNATATKDGATTISSGHSQQDADETTLLRDERNSFRDLCLTLGAEISKLKNQMACNSLYPEMPYPSSSIQQPYNYGTSSYGPGFMPPFHHGTQYGTNRTMAAMSDAGVFHQDVAMSEDGTADITQGTLNAAENAGFLWTSNPNKSDHVRQTSAGGTRTGSDACSTENGPVCQGSVAFSGFRSTQRDNLVSVSPHGLQSRLSKDIESFLRAITAQLKKQEIRRLAATQRLSRLVTAIWPRAQVKIHGSQVSNLCLPSSDIDFVICLPAVHKKDIAVAPGVLEGRNAINETNHKMLARKLKSESWIGESTSLDFKTYC